MPKKQFFTHRKSKKIVNHAPRNSGYNLKMTNLSIQNAILANLDAPKTHNELADLLLVNKNDKQPIYRAVAALKERKIIERNGKLTLKVNNEGENKKDEYMDLDNDEIIEEENVMTIAGEAEESVDNDNEFSDASESIYEEEMPEDWLDEEFSDSRNSMDIDESSSVKETDLPLINVHISASNPDGDEYLDAIDEITEQNVVEDDEDTLSAVSGVDERTEDFDEAEGNFSQAEKNDNLNGNEAILESLNEMIDDYKENLTAKGATNFTSNLLTDSAESIKGESKKSHIITINSLFYNVAAFAVLCFEGDFAAVTIANSIRKVFENRLVTIFRNITDNASIYAYLKGKSFKNPFHILNNIRKHLVAGGRFDFNGIIMKWEAKLIKLTDLASDIAVSSKNGPAKLKKFYSSTTIDSLAKLQTLTSEEIKNYKLIFWYLEQMFDIFNRKGYFKQDDLEFFKNLKPYLINVKLNRNCNYLNIIQSFCDDIIEILEEFGPTNLLVSAFTTNTTEELLENLIKESREETVKASLKKQSFRNLNQRYGVKNGDVEVIGIGKTLHKDFPQFVDEVFPYDPDKKICSERCKEEEGELIECSNVDCPYRWFHKTTKCLKSVQCWPSKEQLWFCSNCKDKMPNSRTPQKKMPNFW